jgi:hypothetical protein
MGSKTLCALLATAVVVTAYTSFQCCSDPFTGGCTVYYKATDNPLDFGSVPEQPFFPNDGNSNRLEVLMFTNVSKGASRIFIANENGREEIFVNTDAVDTVAGSLSMSFSGRRVRENSALTACRLTAVHGLRIGFS